MTPAHYPFSSLVFFGVLFTCLAFSSADAAYAQSLTMSGTVQDAQGEPAPFLNVLLYAPSAEEDILIKTAVTAEDGSFRMGSLAPADYRLSISGVGYSPLDSLISLRANRDMGVLVLSASVQSLDEIVVGAARPMVVVEPDKMIFNVSDNLATAGDSGFDVLRKAPGVIVDQNDNILIEGLSGVRVFLDGKPSVLRGEDLVNYLKSLRAEDIDNIEIITQPSAKYDAEGNAGIINIVRVREKGLGVQGSATAGLTYGDFARGNGSVNLNYRARKFNLYGSYGGYMGKNTSFMDFYRLQSGNAFDSETDMEMDRMSHNIRTGLDWYLNPKHTLSVLTTFDVSDLDILTDSRTQISTAGSAGPDSILTAPNRTMIESLNGSANINYQFTDTVGNTLTVDVDYGRYNNQRNVDQPNFYFGPDGSSLLSENLTRQEAPTDISLYSSKLDYERRMGKHLIETGIKWTRVETENTFSFFQTEGDEEFFDPDRSNRFGYDESVYAAYASYNVSVGKAWKLQGGLRMEHTESLGDLRTFNNQPDDQVARSYTDWFPSGGITYQAAPKHSLALRYNRRIQRPDYQSLNPFEYPLDELSYRKGNPFLQPQYSNKVRLSHTWKYSFTTTLSYSYVTDFFAQVTEAVDETRNFIITRNVANETTWNLGVSTPINITDWWGAYTNVYAYHQAYTATDPAFLAINRWTAGGYAQTTFSLPWDLDLELSGWYQSPSIWGGTYRTNGLGAVNAAVQRSFAERWNVRLAVNDIFFTSPWVADTQFGDLVIQGTGGNDSRQFKINLSYRFGDRDVKSQRKRETGLDDAKDRIGGE